MKPGRVAPRAARARAVTAALAATVVLGAAGCSSSDSTGGAKNTYKFTSATKTGTVLAPDARKKAGDVGGGLLGGGTTKLSNDRGKVVVINFWGSWCPPCRVETPQLDSLYRTLKGKDVAFLGVDIKDDRDDAKAFVKQNDITYPMLYDQEGRSVITLGNPPGSPPFTILVDKTGKVAAIYLGTLTPKDLEPPIRTLLAES